jgi:hypothetical protein
VINKIQPLLFDIGKLSCLKLLTPQTFKPSSLQTFKPSNLQTFQPSTIGITLKARSAAKMASMTSDKNKLFSNPAQQVIITGNKCPKIIIITHSLCYRHLIPATIDKE